MYKIEHKYLDTIYGRIDSMELGDTFGCTNDELGSILDSYFESKTVITKNINIMNCPFTSFGRVRDILGNVSIVNCQNIESLGHIETTKGLNISYCGKLTDLSSLLGVYGKFSIYKTPVDDLLGLAYAEDIYFSNVALDTFETLSKCRDLSISDSPYFDNFGNLREITGDLVIKNIPAKSLNNIISIDRSLDVRETTLKDFGELQNLGGYIVMKESQVPSVLNTNIDKYHLSKLRGIFSVPNLIHLVIPSIDKLKDVNLAIVEGE